MADDGSDADVSIHAVTDFRPDFEADSVLLVVSCFGERYVLEVRLTNFQAAKDYAAEFARRFDRLRQLDERLDDVGNLHYEAQLKLEDWILEPFQPHLKAANDSESAAEQSWTMGECFLPKTSCYRLIMDSKALVYQEQDVESSRKTMGIPHMAASNITTNSTAEQAQGFQARSTHRGVEYNQAPSPTTQHKSSL